MKQCRALFALLFLAVCLSVLCLSASAFDIRDVQAPESATKIVYGQSGAGRDLVAYRFGNGENVLVAGFAIHGYEDNFDRDGGCLVYTANELMKVLDANRGRITDYGWTVYVLPSMNPDGLIDGYTCNGPGRCTTTYLNSSGQLVRGRGTDMNRSFPHNWTQYTDSRNFNGSGPLASREAQALAAFVKEVKGTGSNICIDAHGWFHQIITSNGNSSKLYTAFSTRFPGSSYANCTSSRGYFTSYTTELGYASCLFEFPGDIYSMDGFLRSGYCGRFNDAILDILKSYGTYAPHSSDCPSGNFPDVIPWAWYHSAVDYVVSNGIFNGVSSTRFSPNAQMTRAMLVTTLYRMTKKGDIGVMHARKEEAEEEFSEYPESAAEPVTPGISDEPAEPIGPQTFRDVTKGAWYEEAVLWAAGNGIVTGYPNGTFAPDAPLTREQLATIFYRYCAWSGRSVARDADLRRFPDAGEVSSYAYDAMCWATGTGLINGISDGGSKVTLSPGGTATRAQTAAIIMRFRESATKASYLKRPVADIVRDMPFMEPTVDAGVDLGGN